jgi:predicted nucleotidyltransferase
MRSDEKGMKKYRSMNEFCRDIVRLLTKQGIEFLVGGSDAFRHYTGINRETKDFDLMVRPSNVAAVLQLCRSAGYGAELTFTHWLAKIYNEEFFVDLIFNSGNGLCVVDDEWFSRAAACMILGTSLKIIPLEELIWQKAYIMERERFDGADIAHLLLKCGERIDWEHLLGRFGPDWRVLLSHLVLFGFIYPSRIGSVPGKVMDELLRRVGLEQQADSPGRTVCNGTFLSRNQFISDIELDRFMDARLDGRSSMSAEEIKEWTVAGATEQRRRIGRRH